MEHKDITARYEGEYPAKKGEIGLHNYELKAQQQAAIKAATYEREMQWKFMKWTHNKGWNPVWGWSGYIYTSERWTNQTHAEEPLTDSQLFQIFLNEKK